jgi:uncharacterized membrane protein YjfL (UPF0719 family)
MDPVFAKSYVFSAIIYSALGLVILFISFIIFDRMTPGHLWKEIILEKNLPLAITVGAMTIAIAMIISSAIHG